MDIHRCRFVPLPPSSINSLEFSHTWIEKKQVTAPPRLAVGRANGDIEIWNPLRGSWFQEIIIHGGKDRSIDGLVWIQDPNEETDGRTIVGKSRLFSIGYTTTITEWNLATGRPLRQASGNHGEIWCIAAQPIINGNNNDSRDGQALIVGCTDGALVLYSTQDDNLQLQRLLVKPSSKKAKIISITFQNRNIVAAGCTDSTIRIFDIRNGNLLRAMSLGSGPKGGPKDVIIWAIRALKDGTIISGDSTGELKIWDQKTYTLRQRISAHKQDILCLAINSDCTAIFSGGMDRRTVLYKPAAKHRGRWIEIAHRRFHDHDVKAMASFEGLGMSVFVSGGHDASPIVVPIGRYGLENQRALPFLPQDTAIRCASKGRLLISWWSREIWIWKIERFSIKNDEDSDEPSGRKLVAKIFIKGEANITSAAIDTEGNTLIVATIAEIKAFHLRRFTKSEGKGYQISTIDVSPGLSCGAKLIALSPDGKWLCTINSENQILLTRLIRSRSLVRFTSFTTILSRMDRNIHKFVSMGGLGTYPRTITRVAFSMNSRILVLSDLMGYIDSYLLHGKENVSLGISTTENIAVDSETENEEEERNLSSVFGQSWTRNPLDKSLPKLPDAPAVLSFRPSHTNTSIKHISTQINSNKIQPDSTQYAEEDRLLVITAKSDIFEFEVLKGKLSDWSRRNPPSVFPERYKMTLEAVKGVIWDVSNQRERIWLYSTSWLWMFDLGKNFGGNKNKNWRSRLKRKRGVCGAGSKIKYSEMSIEFGENPSELLDQEINEELSLPHDINDIELDEDEYQRDDPHILQNKNLSDSDLTVNEQIKVSKELQKTSDNESTVQDTLASSRAPFSTYHTFKYRPIAGLVALENGSTVRRPEVVLVERPIWDTELPLRYCGDQEWRSHEVDG